MLRGESWGRYGILNAVASRSASAEFGNMKGTPGIDLGCVAGSRRAGSWKEKKSIRSFHKDESLRLVQMRNRRNE